MWIASREIHMYMHYIYICLFVFFMITILIIKRLQWKYKWISCLLRVCKCAQSVPGFPWAPGPPICNSQAPALPAGMPPLGAFVVRAREAGLPGQPVARAALAQRLPYPDPTLPPSSGCVKMIMAPIVNESERVWNHTARLGNNS